MCTSSAATTRWRIGASFLASLKQAMRKDFPMRKKHLVFANNDNKHPRNSGSARFQIPLTFSIQFNSHDFVLKERVDFVSYFVRFLLSMHHKWQHECEVIGTPRLKEKKKGISVLLCWVLRLPHPLQFSKIYPRNCKLNREIPVVPSVPVTSQSCDNSIQTLFNTQ